VVTESADKPSAPAPVAAAPQLPVAAATPATAVHSPAPASDSIDQAIERARVALSRGQYLQALSGLESLEAVPANRADYWLVKGSALLATGQLEAAQAAFATAQSLAPDNPQIAVQQAIVQQEQGDHLAALRILQAAAGRHPDVPEIFLNQGYSQLALGAESQARGSFRTFMQLTENRTLYLQQRQAVERWLRQLSLAGL
jgi:tetratricopeptide (TPR) repeat protein